MVAIIFQSFSHINKRDGFPSPSHHLKNFRKDSIPYTSTQPPPTPQAPTSSRISPAVLFIIVILAVIFFISGLLHLLVRLLMKKHHRASAGAASSSPHRHHRAAEVAGPDALQRQLQQLFHLHDAGLDQAFIDALPVFSYREIVGGAKEPFDCAVCLCEFAEEDKLRLLPVCGHAFHLNCIDTWLLSNSTCPLCRGTLFVPELSIENSMFDFDERLEEGRLSGDQEDPFPLPTQKPMEADHMVAEKRLFPVRLGKFKNLGHRGSSGLVEDGNAIAAGTVSREEGESSSCNLDARRCFSMGTYQYVLGTSDLRVALRSVRCRNGDGGMIRERAVGISTGNAEIVEGKKICARNKGESFSVSKIWQWSNAKGKLPALSDDCSESGSFPWMKRSGGDT